MDTSETTPRKIKTRLGGEVEITDRNLVRIAEGLLGFPDFEEFALIPHGEESPFLWLQSVDEPELAFITIDPRIFQPDYLPDVAPDDLTAIGLSDIASAALLAIVVIPENPERMTANLQGPVLINPATHLGRQVISRSTKHRVRHYILSPTGDAPAEGR
jgi:flagellar assembly factor FliW